MPTTRLVDTVRILAEITKLHKTVRIYAHTNLNFEPSSTHDWTRKGVWTVELTYNDNTTKLEIKADAMTFDEALQDAWERFSTACRSGVGANVLMPPIEQKIIPWEELQGASD